ncbi:MAG TPA: lanthionine synthetase LanC family protein [Solirubrobacteraceae bacterium]
MTTSYEFIDVAAALAVRLADTAIWHGERCNWIGVVPRDPARTQGRKMLEALGPDLYGGTAGIALFLAEAAATLGDDHLRTVARGAIRHALEHARDADGDGLHQGAPGIAYAAARVAIALDSEFALSGAREVLDDWWVQRDVATEWDVIGGCAGTVSALVTLSHLMEDPTLLQRATIAGDELIAAAVGSDDGMLWPDPTRASVHGLCGFSHGAAGIGHALIELWGATGQARFRDVGVGAFDYERSWFERREGTWPDLREIQRRAGHDAPAPVSPTWCHGAPGIAVSRLRAARLLESETVRRDAHAALSLTRRHVSELSSRAHDDFSLCHGAAGAADALLYGADASGLAERIGQVGIERHHRSASGFPCGIPDGETPGLFIGLAGIGLFYLRLSDAGIPTALVVHR